MSPTTTTKKYEEKKRHLLLKFGKKKNMTNIRVYTFKVRKKAFKKWLVHGKIVKNE